MVEALVEVVMTPRSVGTPPFFFFSEARNLAIFLVAVGADDALTFSFLQMGFRDSLISRLKA
jgi:hypothetical protein